MKNLKYFLILWVILMGMELRLIFKHRETSSEFFIILGCLAIVTIIITIMAFLHTKEKQKKDHEIFLTSTPNVITKEQIKTSFLGLTECDDLKKKKLIIHYYKSILSNLIPLIIMYILVLAPFIYTKDEKVTEIILVLAVISTIYLYIIIQDIKKILIVRSENIFYCPVFIHDSKSRGRRYTYDVQVKDQNNYILDYWFEVYNSFLWNKKNINLYYAEHNAEIFVDIKKED